MDDFEIAYCLDPNAWGDRPVDTKPTRIDLPGLMYPVEDPLGVSSMMTAKELENLILNVQVKMVWFDLEKPEDLAACTDVYQRGAVQQVILQSEESSRERPFLKLIRWAEFYYTIPDQFVPGLQAR